MTNTPDKSEMLLPCPFCGNDASVSDGSNGLHFRVICNKSACRAAGPLERCAVDAKDAWNTRASSRPADQAPDMVERVARALKECGRRASIGMSDCIWTDFAKVALQAVPAEVGEKESVYRDIFAEITAKAQPLCEDESDPEKITGYRLPVGPLHRAAGKTGFQMFNGEAHLARAVRDIDRLKTTLKQVKVLLISAASRDSHMAPEYERRKAREATDVIDTALKASGEE